MICFRGNRPTNVLPHCKLDFFGGYNFLPRQSHVHVATELRDKKAYVHVGLHCYISTGKHKFNVWHRYILTYIP